MQNMLRTLLVFLCAHWVAARPSPNPPARGLPGISKTDKSVSTSAVRLFRMRNLLAAWYCTSQDGARGEMVPCVNMYSMEDKPRPSKPVTLDAFKVMYTTFCEEAKTHKHHDTICNDELFRKTYS